MHRLPVLVCALVCAMPGLAPASTLDPSHPVWSHSPHAAEWHEALVGLRADQAPPAKLHPVAARGRVAAVGRRVLVIPVLPADAGGAPRTQAALAALWNGGGEATVRGFWRHVSAGGLELDVRVLPWLEVPGTLQSNYFNVLNGAPSANLTAGPRNLAADALAAATRVVEDLHVFDDDGPDGLPGSGDDDGVIDCVVVLHPFPGWETDPVDVPRAIVSLQSRLSGDPIPGTELRADAFVVASASGPLGVWAHELGHLLGLPDLYDLDRNPLPGTPGEVGPQGGLGRWSLMASGTWGGEGALPSGLDPWSRWTLGFGEFNDEDTARRIGLPWIDADGALSARIQPLGEWGEEFFLVEARRPRPEGIVDGDLPGTGALVYRVRPDLTDNLVAAKFVELLQADGDFDLDTGANDGDATDPWDGSPGRARLDGSTTPSTQSALAPAVRTPPALEFNRFSAGMEVVLRLAAGAALRLDAFGFEDAFFGTRTWLRPGERASLELRLKSVGDATPVNPFVEAIGISGRPVTFDPAGPWPLVESAGEFILASPVSVRDEGSAGEEGVVSLTLRIGADGASSRSVPLGLPVAFSDGLPEDALARFSNEASSAGPDTTRFVRLPLASLPSPAFVGYELQTEGVPAYGNSMIASLSSPWFGPPRDGRVWLWTRGDTEEGIPGQVFDGAALELFIPERGWMPLEPEGRRPVWISRRSAAATRDRVGLGGFEPEWTPYSAELPGVDLPTRVRVRFASDATIAGGNWSVAGVQTDAAPTAAISFSRLRDGRWLASARLSGDFSRVTAGSYRYRVDPQDDWKPASGIFNISGSEIFNIVLDLLPEDVMRAEVALFSGIGDANYQLGSAGLRRDPVARLPRLLRNPAQGMVVLQTDASSQPLPLVVYDIRGRRRARVTIPADTTWFEWVPESDDGEVLSSGSYFLRVEGMDSRTTRFTWFR